MYLTLPVMLNIINLCQRYDDHSDFYKWQEVHNKRLWRQPCQNTLGLQPDQAIQMINRGHPLNETLNRVLIKQHLVSPYSY